MEKHEQFGTAKEKEEEKAKEYNLKSKTLSLIPSM